jgi:hypothetical protein
MSVASHSSETSELFAEALAGADRQKALLKQLAKALGAKKTRAPGPPGPGSAWTAWTSQAKTLFPEEYAEHLAELPPNAKGVQPKNDPMGFAKKCRASLHVDEWNAFEAKWKEEHPKAEKPAKAAKEPKAPKAATAPKPKAVKAVGGAGAPPEEEAFSSSSSACASDGELSSASKKSGLPKATPPPPKAAAKAAAKPKPASKADKTKEKEAAVARAAAAAEADPPVPFKYRGKDYLKNDKNQVWAVGEDGAVGAWHGTYDGKKMEKTDGPAA